jgi:hypothetical protein
MSKYVSPKGVAGYPKLIKPDTKFKADGEYSTSLTMDKKDAEAFISQIEEAYVEEFGQKAVAKANYPFKEEEGKVTFKFKSKNKPKLYDSKGKPILNAEDLNIGSGSVLSVAGAISCRAVSGKNYATLYMNQVQLIKLVEYSSSPFGEQEGGFVAEEPAADTFGSTSEAPADEEDDF